MEIWMGCEMLFPMIDVVLICLYFYSLTMPSMTGCANRTGSDCIWGGRKKGEWYPDWMFFSDRLKWFHLVLIDDPIGRKFKMKWPDEKKSLWYFVWRLEGALANITGTFIFSMSGVLKREKRTMKYTLFVHFWRNRTHIRWKNEKSQNLNKEKSQNPLIFQGKMSTIHLALREKEC